MSPSRADDQRRLYADLAWTWPIVSPAEHYVEEAEDFCRAIRDYAQIEVKTLLDLGCGGGHNDHLLKSHFEVTGVDMSEAMLSLARRLNPGVTYLAGDMRTVRLGKTFDAITIADAIIYMLTEDDLRAAFETAFAHLKPGGVFCTYADELKETFRQNTVRSSAHTRDGAEITLFEQFYDPDPEDTTYEMTFVYLIRRGGKLEIETDRHLAGLFSHDTWVRLMTDVGFEVNVVEQEEFDAPMFVGVRPPG